MRLNERVLSRYLLIIVGGIFLCPGKVKAEEKLVYDYKEIGAYLSRCWVPPRETLPGVRIEVTFSFALRSDGSVIGQPSISYFSPARFTGLRKKYRAAVFNMLEVCTPVPLSASLGSRIAGRVNRLRFVHDTNEQESPAWRSTLKIPSSWKPQKAG